MELGQRIGKLLKTRLVNEEDEGSPYEQATRRQVDELRKRVDAVDNKVSGTLISVVVLLVVEIIKVMH